MANIVELGHRTFTTQQDATRYFGDMLARYAPRDTVVGEDAVDLDALVSRHPSSSRKRGAGILRFFVGSDPWGYRCFNIERIDGSSDNFSIQKCVTGRNLPLEQRFLAACRVAIGPDVRDAKVQYFRENADSGGYVCCDVTGEPVLIDDAHVDHKPPLTMQVVVHAFLTVLGAPSLTADLFERPTDGQFSVAFAAAEVVEAFRKFHRDMTDGHLRIVKARKNLEMSSQHCIRKVKNPVRIRGEK